MSGFEGLYVGILNVIFYDFLILKLADALEYAAVSDEPKLSNKILTYIAINAFSFL
jgi:hypothetical protein